MLIFDSKFIICEKNLSLNQRRYLHEKVFLYFTRLETVEYV